MAATGTPPVKRKLAAILAADAVGYSRLMAADEEGTVRLLQAHRAVIDGIIEFHEGRIVNTAGDSVIAEFASPVQAVRCAVEIQDALRTRNDSLPEDERLQFRIGVNLGDGVNVAARIESITDPGGISVSSSVYDQIAGKLDLGFVDAGNKSLKNIDRPVRVYRVERTGAGRSARTRRRSPALRWLVGIAAAVAVAAGTWHMVWVPMQEAERRAAAEEQAARDAQFAKMQAEAEAERRRIEEAAEKERARAETARRQAEAGAVKQRAAADAARKQAEERAAEAAQAKRALETQRAAEARAARRARVPARAHANAVDSKDKTRGAFMLKSVLGCGISIVCGTLPAGVHAVSLAAEFPARPIRIVVGFTPGGQPDIFSRMIGGKLAESFGQPVVVDNRPGAGGAIGTKIVAHATPDGHTLLSVSGSHVISPVVRKLNYDTAKDFAGITLTYNSSYVLVAAPSLGAGSVKELIAMAKAKPGALNFGSAGTGSGTHFAGEMFKDAAGIDVVHVPYKGIPEALNDTMTNRVQFFMAPLASAINLVRDGKLRALGVTSLKRVSIQPDIPTIAESGLSGFSWDSWGGNLAPAKTPRATVERLNREIVRVLGLPDIQKRMRALGAEPEPTTPEAFDKFIREQLFAIAAVAKKAGIKPQ